MLEGLAAYRRALLTNLSPAPDAAVAKTSQMKRSPSSHLPRGKLRPSGGPETPKQNDTTSTGSSSQSQRSDVDSIPCVRVPPQNMTNGFRSQLLSDGDHPFEPLEDVSRLPSHDHHDRLSNELPSHSSLQTQQYATLPRHHASDRHRSSTTHSHSITDLTSVSQQGGHHGQANNSNNTSPSSHARGLYHAPSMNSCVNGYQTLPSNMGSNFQAAAFNSAVTPSFASAGSRRSMFEPLDRFMDELNVWQHQHQEQLRRQMENIHVSNLGSSYQPSSRFTTPITTDPHKLDSIKRAADDIIIEKDNIIDRQRLKILQLEQLLSESGPQYHSSLLRKAQTEIDSLNTKLEDKLELNQRLQDALSDNSRLRTQVNEIRSTKSSELQTMERKLAAAEYELSELQQNKDRATSAQARELEARSDRLELAEHSVHEWKEKHANLARECQELRQRALGLEQYLGNLPSQEEHGKVTQELRTVKEDKARYKQRAQELEKRVKDLIRGIESRNSLVQSLEESEKLLTEQIATHEREKEALKKEVRQLRDDGAFIPDEEMSKLQHENRKLKEEIVRAKKLLEVKEKKFQQQEQDHRQAVGSLKDRLSREEESVAALRREQTDQQVELEELKSQLHQMGQQNQDLLEKQLTLTDKIAAYELQYNSEVESMQRKLLRELHLCFSELKSLVQVCSQFAEGQDPNISALLGLRGTSSTSDLSECPSVSDAAQALDYKLEQLYSLREQVDHLRDLLSTKYAEDMGANLTCIQQ